MELLQDGVVAALAAIGLNSNVIKLVKSGGNRRHGADMAGGVAAAVA